MRIFWDITKTSKNKVYSGLNRVSAKLRESLVRKGCSIHRVEWAPTRRSFRDPNTRELVKILEQDVFITPELFCENERMGFTAWLEQCKGTCAAIFHDAIPLKFPEFTWPKSVARHPYYLKELVGFDFIFANSDYSRQELLDYWSWLNLIKAPPVHTIPLGADFSGSERMLVNTPVEGRALQLLMIGILEPRKNQEVVLDAIEMLHAKRLCFQLFMVGRVNPHFGKPIQKRIEKLIQKGLPLQYFQQISDAALLNLYHNTDLTLFPSRTEGNGLPIIESIWHGKPSIASPIPPHLEHAKGGEGVIVVDPMNASTLASVLEQYITDPSFLKKSTEAAHLHNLPTWDESADAMISIIQAS